MGCWGVQNFDSDAALDFVGGISGAMTEKVENWLDDEDHDLSDGEGEVIPAIVIIKLLTENCGVAPPKAEEIVDWRERYLACYDEQIDDFEPEDDFKIERRKILVETFKSVESACRAFWDQANNHSFTQPDH